MDSSLLAHSGMVAADAEAEAVHAAVAVAVAVDTAVEPARLISLAT